VGVLAKTRATFEALSNRVGVKAMTAGQALDTMADVLAGADGTADDAVIAVAQMDWATARARLRLLDSPTYAALPGADQSINRSEEILDVRQAIESHGLEHARKVVQMLIVEEVARVLRVAKENVGVNRPLSEIGLDSLMAVELAINLQDRLGEVPPLSTMGGNLTVAEVAKQVLAVAQPPSRH
jgi:acyl carrier protein